MNPGWLVEKQRAEPVTDADGRGAEVTETMLEPSTARPGARLRDRGQRRPGSPPRVVAPRGEVVLCHAAAEIAAIARRGNTVAC
jgi:hypothetical protein